MPRALALLGRADEAPRGAWAAGWERVPLHALLPWGAQMLSLLEGAAGDALLPTLQARSAVCKCLCACMPTQLLSQLCPLLGLSFKK